MSETEDGGLRASNSVALDLHRNILNRAEEGICVCHSVPEFPFVSFTIWNDRMMDITGYSLEEINRLGWYQSMYPDPEVRERAIDRMSHMREGQDIRQEEWEVARSDGQRRTLRISTALVRAADDQVHVLGLMYDVTQERAAAAALKARDAIFHAVHLFSERFLTAPRSPESVPDLLARLGGAADGSRVILFERDGTDPGVLLHAREHWTGPGAQAPVLSAIRLAPGGLERWAARLGSGQVLCEEIERLPPGERRALGDASPRTVLAAPVIAGKDWWGVLWMDDSRSGRPWSSAVQLAFETTANILGAALLQASTLAAAEQARHEAEEANRAKDLFLATLSHELRTPLSSILLRTEAAARSDRLDLAGARKAFEAIGRSARAQAALIEDLLDVSRIIAGKVVLQTQVVDLASQLEASLETVRAVAEQKALAIEAGALQGPPLWVEAEPRRLQQILWNLLVNAVHFTPAGGRVTVTIERQADRALLRVSDTGTGITPEALPHVFDMFFQHDAGTTRARGGLGLGLTLVRHLVELHQGTVEATSSGLGFGSSFTVSLPCVEPPVVASPPAPLMPSMQRLDGVRLLVVDDDVGNLQATVELLRSVGARVDMASSATEALQRLEQSVPDALVCDIAMPEIDGCELLRRVRALPAERGGRLPAVAFSALASEADRRRVLEAGFQTHVTKPAEGGQLLESIAALAGRGTTPGSACSRS